MGEDYEMNFMLFPHMHMLFMTDKEFHLKIDSKKFQSRPGYRCRNVTIGVATSISYSHLHTEYVLNQGLRKNSNEGSWDVATLQFVDMAYCPVAPSCAIPPIKPQTCIFNALTNIVEELKARMKVQDNLSSYKTVP